MQNQTLVAARCYVMSGLLKIEREDFNYLHSVLSTNNNLFLLAGGLGIFFNAISNSYCVITAIMGLINTFVVSSRKKMWKNIDQREDLLSNPDNIHTQKPKSC